MEHEVGVPYVEAVAARAFGPPDLPGDEASGQWPRQGRDRAPTRPEVLDHAMRARIFEELGQRPGASALDLAFATGCSYASTRYHLGRLERVALVLRQGGTRPVRYFTAGPLSKDHRLGVAVLRGRTAARVMGLIEARPGVTKADLGRATGLGGPTVAWHVKRLHAAGLIEVGHDGRRIPLRPVADRMAAVARALGHEPADATPPG